MHIVKQDVTLMSVEQLSAYVKSVREKIELEARVIMIIK